MRTRHLARAALVVLALSSPAAAWITSLGRCGDVVEMVAAANGDPIVVCNRDGVRIARLDRCDGTVRWKRRLPGGAVDVRATDDGAPIVVTMEVPNPRRALYRMGVHRLDPDDGASRWRWRSRDLIAWDANGNDRSPPDWSRFPGLATMLEDGDVAMVLPSLHVVRLDGDTGAERWLRDLAFQSQPRAIAATSDGAIVFSTYSSRFALTAVEAIDGATRWTRDGSSTEEHIQTIEPAADGAIHVAGTDELEGSPIHAFLARIGGDGTEQWRGWPFPRFGRPTEAVRLEAAGDGTLLAWGNVRGQSNNGYGTAALLEPTGAVRWHQIVRLANGDTTRLLDVQRRPDGDVMMLAGSTFQPAQQVLQRLEPRFGLPRTRVEQPGRPSAMLVDRRERLFLARRVGAAPWIFGLGPTPGDCP